MGSVAMTQDISITKQIMVNADQVSTDNRHRTCNTILIFIQLLSMHSSYTSFAS